jgi:UDP-glucose 4-epimerase
MDKPKILITGGAGYIGSFIIRELEKDYKLLVVDNLEEGNLWAIGNQEFIKADIGDIEIMSDIIKNFKPLAVIHCASYIVAPQSVYSPFTYYHNNFCKSLNFLNLCIKNSVKNFIFSSTAAVYGNPQYIPVDESHPINPINPYGASKSFLERAILDFHNAYGLNYMILRYFNAAGASLDGKLGQSKKEPTHLITRIMRTIIGIYDKLEIYGNCFPTNDGTAIRDYIHILDLAHLHRLALEYLLETGKSEILNLGYGSGYSVLEVVERARKIIKNFKYVFSKPREGDPPVLIADIQKLKSTFNFKPKYDDLDIILKTAYDWEVYRYDNNL